MPTGLTGRYDFQLRFTPDANQLANFGGLEPANGADLNAPPDIFTAPGHKPEGSTGH